MAQDKNPYSATTNLRLKNGILRFDKKWASNPIPVGYTGLYVGTDGNLYFVKNGVPVLQSSLESVSANMGTIATTSTTDVYVIAPKTGLLTQALFSALAALAASDTDYITFSITNLGQAGSGTAAMLAATAANTTQVTGGTAITANAKRTLTLSGTAANLAVVAGDRIRIRATATGTLANTVTASNFLLSIAPTA